MKKLHFVTDIKSPREKVWDTMLGDATYRDWSRLFNPAGSSYEGTWEKGTKIKFLGLDEQGESVGGMYSEITDNQKHAYISIRHLGMLEKDGTPTIPKDWQDAYENYTLTEKDGTTHVLVELDVEEEWKEHMNTTWPRALARLKVLCEDPQSITINAVVKAPLDKVWTAWTTPEHIQKWNQANNDWHCPKAINDLKVGGRFCSTMAARDGSASFDFTGTYINVEEKKRILYIMDDGRSCEVEFDQQPDGVHITSTFQMESENNRELQQGGWQSILNSFKTYVESH